MAPMMRYDGGAEEWRPLSGGIWVPPSTGSLQNIAVIGDSTMYQGGAGATNIPRALEAKGWDPNRIWFYAISSKPQWSADTQGKTLAQNVADARAFFATRGGEPTWLINLGANNASSSDATNATQVGLMMDELNRFGARVIITGISQANSFDATNRNRWNRVSRRIVDRRPNSEWFDWNREIKGYADDVYWNADGVHMTTAGYAIKNAWFATIAGRPTDLPSLSLRPEGPGFQRYEDLYVTGDTLQAVANKVAGGNALTFPNDVFTWNDFEFGGGTNGVRLGSDASGQVCRGFIGSGDTIFRMVPNSSTKTPPAQSPLALLHIWKQRRPIFANFVLEGTEQNGNEYGGLRFSYCDSPTVFNVRAFGANVGSINEPPGETFGVNFFQSDNGAIIDSDFDGRRRGSSTRVSTSPFGWNTSKNAYVRRSKFHDHLAGMPTFWETTNIHTVDLWSENNGSGSGKVNGQGINHEKVGGVITHVRPTLLPNRAAGNTGLHLSLNNSLGIDPAHQFGDATDVWLYDVVHDPGPTGGCFAVQISANYHQPTASQTQTTPPNVTKNGVTLTPRYAAQGTANPNPATEYFIYQ